MLPPGESSGPSIPEVASERDKDRVAEVVVDIPAGRQRHIRRPPGTRGDLPNR
jgi:hypothetical protein